MKGRLLIAALGAFAYYKYSRLSQDQKRELADNIKQKGKQLYDRYVPESLKNKIPGKV